MTNTCPTCGAEAECRICKGDMVHVHYTTGEPPDWMHKASKKPLRFPDIVEVIT